MLKHVEKIMFMLEISKLVFLNKQGDFIMYICIYIIYIYICAYAFIYIILIFIALKFECSPSAANDIRKWMLAMHVFWRDEHFFDSFSKPVLCM